MSVRLLGGVAAGVALVVILVLGGFYLHFAQNPPAVADGLQRFTVSSSSNGANSPGRAIRVDEQTVFVNVLGVSGSGSDAEAQLGIQVPGEDGAAAQRSGRVSAGDAFDVGTVTIEVVHVWKVPSQSRSAVDLRLSVG